MINYPVVQLFYKFFLSIALGALIGIEREKKQQYHKGKDFAGIRTFMLITFFGTVTAYLSSLYYDWLIAVVLLGIMLFVLAGYILSSYINKDIGMTTELSAIIAFVIGILVIKAPQEISIITAVVVTLLLSFKSYLHDFAYHLKSSEFFDTIKFLLIAFVILPLLKPFPSLGPINFYEIWLMVVFVSGLSYIGYILIKIFGTSRGTVLTGLLGGILSSTAVVSSLAQKSKSHKNITAIVAASAIASSTMFIRVLIEVAILNFNIIEKLAFPMVLLSLAGYASISIMWKRKSHADTELEFSSPLMLKPALKFGLFYGFILVVSNLLQNFGSSGILITGMISGIADVDAITIYVARHPNIETSVGVMAITLAAIVNTVVKIGIGAIFGIKEYGTALTKVLFPIVITGLVILLIF